MFKVVELLLGLSLSFVGGVGVADRAGKTKGTVSVYAHRVTSNSAKHTL
jgi:hypothetical protein